MVFAMADPPRLLYWDSCVFLSYLSKRLDRIGILEAIVDLVEKGDSKTKIVTSVVAKVEVAFVENELPTPENEQLIDDFWADDSVVELLELHDQIAKLARKLVRESKLKNGQMKPLDAIHLATAISFKVTEFHTYDLGHFTWYQDQVDFKICEPYIAQPKLIV